ncbi:GDP polyribonucleotidyltransferase [Actinidia chinensis var. chinensis]|uniref:GDP polyribonucleotidyltransferase n=1 Tax=Actinidia chinensis var. chinensis TaxID=1590841 RepID=A0A2R6R084_ACTCC|nr:GDP polyribonucleotidyltransferase [Actinidia chinensis var. chinensis]
MANYFPKSMGVTLLIFAIILNPVLPCKAAQVAHRDLLAKPPPPLLLCPDCVCCEPAPPGSCCRCGC